ncbi:tenascin [Toxorhynchites rutilus septentrionalis]|uniref:tenascin n=1 Tax=Toxorhynchites rutilus septentrionalis TaxID=329112 RepID=UPI00247AD011|nr:tenascin [Toxorhynchites rutilus septentrionalis]
MLKIGIFFLVCLPFLQIARSDDIIDAFCETDHDCETFRTSAVNATCINGSCECVEVSSGNCTSCKPVVFKSANQIGGQCPCHAENSVCSEKTQLCVCMDGYQPSRGGKKCIEKFVPLGKPCEIDEQCLRMDHFSVCDPVELNCTCSRHFVSYEHKCHSIIAIATNVTCTQPSDCSNQTANSICYESQCICDTGFVANDENTTCLAISNYEQACIDTNQCIAQLGVGSVCNAGKCVCNEQHFPFPIHSHDAIAAQNSIRVICKRKVVHGASCNDDKDCYAFHQGPHEQTMECFMGECVCSSGFTVKDNICISNSGSSIKHGSCLLTALLFILFATHAQ